LATRGGAPRNASDDELLDAARACLLAVGWRRTTLTDVARRAGVSRMTLYRRWPDTQTLMADLMTREWTQVGSASALLVAGDDSPVRRISRGVVEVARALRGNPLFRKIVEVDPEVLLTYLIDRRGRTQDVLLDLLVEQLAQGQAAGVIRAGDTAAMARGILLAAHGYVISASTMTDGVKVSALDDELEAMLERYLTA
jgi:AcrR family transcriptional regulator